MKFAEVIVRPNGDVEYLHNDALQPLAAALGTSETRRASNVEPWHDLSVAAKEIALKQWIAEHRQGLGATLTVGDAFQAIREQWFADMTPKNAPQGPVLGPFPTRQEALDAEVAWIHKHRFGIPDNDDSDPDTAARSREHSHGQPEPHSAEIVREPVHDALDPAE